MNLNIQSYYWEHKYKEVDSHFCAGGGGMIEFLFLNQFDDQMNKEDRTCRQLLLLDQTRRHCRPITVDQTTISLNEILSNNSKIADVH